MTQDISAPLGAYRLLVVCLENGAENMPSPTRTMYEQMDWEGFAERDLLLVELTKDDVMAVTLNSGQSFAPAEKTQGQVAGLTGNWRRTPITRGGEYIRKTAKCQNDYDFALIGKDTSLKQRWEISVPQEELYPVIDAMPMRRFEMRRRTDQAQSAGDK